MVSPSLTKPKHHVFKNYNCNWIDILSKMFWRKNLKPFLVSNLISLSFLVSFEWFINLWVYQLDIYKTSFKSKCNETITKELNLKVQNYNLISTKVNRPTTIHLRFQRKLKFYTFFFCFVVKMNFVAFCLTLPML